MLSNEENKKGKTIKRHLNINIVYFVYVFRPSGLMDNSATLSQGLWVWSVWQVN